MRRLTTYGLVATLLMSGCAAPSLSNDPTASSATPTEEGAIAPEPETPTSPSVATGPSISIAEAELSPIPTKVPSEELNQWLQTLSADTPDQTELQSRIPSEALVAWLEAAWQQNVDPAEVQAALQAADWQDSVEDFQAIDVNNDGQAEWLVTVYFSPEGMPWGRQGDFWIVGDRLLYRFFQPEQYFSFPDENTTLDQDFLMSAPQVLSVKDMTGNGQPNLLLQRNTCGASTCTQAYFVLGEAGGSFQQLVTVPPNLDSSGHAIVMPYSEVESLDDETGDGLPDLTIHGGTFGSAGAGIQRARTEVWAWNGQAITLAETRWDPTTYRFHILYEANENFAQGNRDRAKTLYEQVINDTTLQDEEWWNESGSIYDSSREFAAFRLALLALQSHDRATATQWSDWLSQTYPDAAITGAATQLLNTWNSQNDLSAACRVVSESLSALEPAEGDLSGTGPTGPLRNMGYGNPALNAADVCPL